MERLRLEYPAFFSVLVYEMYTCAVNCSLDEGGVFKSKKPTRYAADEIQETWETKTDLPVDQRRAEEVEVVVVLELVVVIVVVARRRRRRRRRRLELLMKFHLRATE